MMKTTIRTLALVLVAMLAVTMAACTNTNGQTATTPTAAAASTAGTAGTAAAPTPEPTAAQPVEISILMSSDNPPPNPDNSILTEIQSRTGYIMNAIIVAGNDYPTKLSSMIASKTLPDILGYGITDGETYRDNGMIIELTDLLSEYGPDILADKGELNTGLNAGDGIWGVPRRAGYPSNLSVRTDWLSNLGLSMPTDTDSLYDVLYAFTYDDPDGNGQQDTVGIGMTMEQLRTFTYIFGAFGVPVGENVKLDDGTVTTYMRHPKFLDAIKYFRKLYLEGVMETEFATIPWVPCVEKLWNGSYGVFDFQGVGTTNNWLGRYTEDPIPTFDFAVIASPGESGGCVQSYAGSYWGITSNCEHPEDAMALGNYLTTEEGDELLYFGIEGKHYEWIDKDAGTYQYLPPYDDSATQRNDGGFIYWGYFVPDHDNAEIRTLNPQTRQGLELAAANYLPDAHIYGALEASKEYGSTLNDIVKEAIASLIVTDGDVDAEYQAFIDRWLTEGGQAWQDEATSVYARENQN